MTSLVGTVLDGQYKIEAELASGALGTIYRARHTLMGRTVTVKVIHPWLCADERALARLSQKANALTSLNHKNIVRVHDIAIIEGHQAYMVMDNWEGPSLADQLESNGPLPWSEAIALFSQVCEALVHAHQHGIIHRDLRPFNIILTSSDEGQVVVKLVDFGLAKLADAYSVSGKQLTPTGDLIGSPLYMSPEQCQGKELLATADIYSLGCVMYETLCGQPPFTAATPAELVSKQLHENPVRLSTIASGQDIPNVLDMLVMKALEKECSKRIQSADEVLDALRAIGQSPSAGSSITGGGIKSESLRQLGRMLRFLAVVLLVLIPVACLCAWYFVKTPQGQAQALEAQETVLETVGAPTDFRLIGPLSALGSLYRSQGNWTKAKACYAKLAPLLEKKYRLMSVETLGAMMDEADMMKQLGEGQQYAQAIEKISLYAGDAKLDRVERKRRLTLMSRILAGEVGTNEVYNQHFILRSVARCNQDLGHFDDAIGFFKRRIELLVETKGEGLSDGNCLEAQIDLGRCYEKAGALSLAESTYLRALDSVKKNKYINFMNRDRQFLEDILSELGIVLALEGKFERALYYATESQKFCLLKFGANSTRTAAAIKFADDMKARCAGLRESTVQGTEKK